MKTLKTLARIALTLLALNTIACDGNKTQPDTCSPCGSNAIVCTATVAACIEDGQGTCKTGGPGDLELHADGTFAQEFGAYAQTGTWVDAQSTLVLTSGGQVVGNIPVAGFGVCQVSQ